jgi:hypothetical protein
MRLTDQQRRIIREAGLRHFGVTPLVFGSRLDDVQRGGDIDLYIDQPMDACQAQQRETRLWTELQKRLGERKIDIVTAHPGRERPIDRIARATGVPA